jgi:hypothetical protein
MPEKEMGHLHRAKQTADDKGRKLPVTYVIATDPQKEYTGHVVDVHRTAEVVGDQGNTVRLRVSTKDDPPQDPRPGATVIAHVKCGRAPVGYVLLRQGYEQAQRFWFWFF